MNQQLASFGTVALVAAFATLTLSAPAHAGRMLDLVKPAAADAASISRGNSSPRAHVSTWQAEAMANNSVSGPVNGGRLFSLEAQPVRADAASISRGHSPARDLDATSYDEVVARSRTGVVKSGQFAQREARCDVRDVCSSGAVGALATQSQPSVQAQGEALTTIR
jgi:hypothetical protein